MSTSGVFIIAEAGVNHNGSLAIAKQLIDGAKAAGADCIKFQSFRADLLVTRHAKKAEYQKETTAAGESQYEMLRHLGLDEQAHIELMNHARIQGITFLSSVFDPDSVDMLERLGVTMFKIPSGEITNHALLRHVAAKRKPLILSTGMSTLGEVEGALDSIYSTGNTQVTVLHCVTEYPAPVAEINLRAMLTMKRAFNVSVGYSDHSSGIEIALAAVALGAATVEKHFTLDRNMIGPDHRASLEPSELRQMVMAIRNIEASLGNGIKKPAPCELKNIPIARKSIVASRQIRAGKKLTGTDVTIKRPGSGVAPKHLDDIIGLKVTKTIEADQPVKWEDLK
jgi:N,N'-diacetyllegionaminate synthase